MDKIALETIKIDMCTEIKKVAVSVADVADRMGSPTMLRFSICIIILLCLYSGLLSTIAQQPLAYKVISKIEIFYFIKTRPKKKKNKKQKTKTKQN